MFAVRSQFALSLMATCFCFSLAQPAFSTQSHKPNKAAAIQAAPPPAAAPQAPVPLTLQQQPATAPRVTYSNGELTIISQNSTLGDILHAVHEQTGATLDVPGNAPERVVGQMGPGSPRDVLAQLLNGSSFNYVILGSATDANKVERVILSSKSLASPENAAQAPANVAPPSQPAEAGLGFNQQSATDDDDDADTSGDPSGSGQPPAQAPVRTPEQLLQELQRQQQQQQQQQQPGQPAPPAQAPPQRN